MIPDKYLPYVMLLICLLILLVVALQVGILQGRRLERMEREARQGIALQKETQAARREPQPLPVRVTAYPPLSRCTDSTPYVTASNQRVRDGIIAVSRDIEQRLGLRFGDRVRISGIGEFEFQDRMHPRHTGAVDIFKWCPKECRRFGVQQAMLEVVRGES